MRCLQVKRAKRIQNRDCQRHGTSLVEAAFVLPVFFFIVFAIIEFGHAQMAINVMQSACRNAARIGCTELSTTTEVANHVDRIMSSAFATATASIYVLDASAFDGSGTPPADGAGIEALPALELQTPIHANCSWCERRFHITILPWYPCRS